MPTLPKTLQARTTLILTALCFGMVLLSTVLFFVYLTIKIIDEEREELTAFATRLDAIISAADNQPRTNHLDVALKSEIDEKMDLVFDENDYNLSYVIYDKQGETVHAYSLSGSFPITMSPRFDPFYVVPTSYKDWTFYAGLQTEHFDAVVASSHDFEILDELFVGLAILLPTALFLSLVAAHRLTTRILIPLRNIEVAANRIAAGNRDARIQKTGQAEETDALIDTLNDTFSQLDDAFAHIESFSANTAHELRTPLTALRGNLEVCLRKPRSEAEYQRAIATAIDEIAHLNGITDSLLVLARNPHQFDREFEAVDLSSLTAAAAEQIAFLAAEKQLTFHTDIAPELTVKGLPRFLTQLVYNLLQNAVRYTPAGGTIRLSLTKPTTDSVELTVKDTGPGIPPELQERIFTRFFRANESHRQQGSGLGLAIVKWIVECHRGTITVDSEPGRGATFSVRLPTAPAAQNGPTP